MGDIFGAKHDPDPLITCLRNMAQQDDVFEWDVLTLNEAADEIDRLRREVLELRGVVRAHEGMYARAAEEIERLRALCNDLYHDATCAESFCRLCGEGIREWEATRG